MTTTTIREKCSFCGRGRERIRKLFSRSSGPASAER